MSLNALVDSLSHKFSSTPRRGIERIASCDEVFVKKDRESNTLKVIMVGPIGSGKSSLMYRWTRNDFDT